MVFPESFAIEAGLGGRFDDILVNEAFVQGAWSFSAINGATVKDITGNGFNATYSGSGITRGVTCPLPEGALGVTTAGTAKASVAYAAELCLADGSMDVVVLFKTSTNDSTLRCFVHCQETDSDGDGWHVAIKDGKMRGFLKVSGATVFDTDFSGDVVSDGEWHVFHLCYEPEEEQVRGFLDGEQYGSTVTGVTTEPDVTSATLDFWQFADGSGPFIGSMAKAMCGREGNPDLAAALQAARTWTDITADVRTSVMPITATYGIQGSSVQDLIAQTGTLTFALDNSEANSQNKKGLYSVGHANCRSGFAVRMPVRLKIVDGGTTYYKWRGFMKSAPPLPDPYGQRYTSVLCVDWIGALARTTSAGLALQASKTADTVFSVVVDGARRPPAAVELNPSIYSFPFAIDYGGDTDTLLSEAVRITASTGALVYIKGDTVGGGTLVYEPRELRQAGKTLHGPFDELRDLGPLYDEERIINVVRATYHPRRTDASSTQVLAQLPVDISPNYIMPGQTVILQAPYRDPNQKGAQISGTDMTCVSGTDYAFNSLANGTGTNLTASMVVQTTFLAKRVEWRITNPTGSLAYATLLRARGRAIYYDDPVTLVERHEESIREHDEREIAIDLPYEGTAAGAREYARLLLAIYSQLTTVLPESITLLANRSSTYMTHALAREVGDLIGAEETQTGITTTAGWYIQHVTLTITQADGGPLIHVRWGLAPSWPESLVVGFSGAATGQHNLTFGGEFELTTPGDYTFVFNRLGDDVDVFGVSGGGGGGGGSADSVNNAGGGGGQGGVTQVDGIRVTIATTTYTGKVGAGGTAGGASAAGGVGGTTEFRVPSGTIHMQLPGGNPGQGASGATGGVGGSGSGAGTGSGNVEGANGEQGGAGTGGGFGDDSADGAGGGGGGGDVNGAGGDGGDGKDQAGLPGGAGGSDPGGAGGRGGGVALANGFRGGGGGGGGGSQSSTSPATAGVGGALTMRIAS